MGRWDYVDWSSEMDDLEFLAEAREAAELRRKEAAKCKMCDGTGYKDHAGFAMDPCSCARRDPSHSAPAK